MKIKEMKEKVIDEIDKRKHELIEVSQYIHKNPESCFEEYKAQAVLTKKLEENQFEVQKGGYGVDTSFKAIYGEKRPRIAFMAEYDALPGLGHACGHNIIAAAALGAGLGIKPLIESGELEGSIEVLGTPAEEGGGGKIIMIENGSFCDIDVAMLMHPTGFSRPNDISLASQIMKFTFKGKTAHAAAKPWNGASALNGLIEFFNATNALRLQVKDYARIHGVITEGGIAPNIIPEKAVGVFSIRALTTEYLMELIDKVKKCAEGVAIATGTEVYIEKEGKLYKEISNNKVLVDLFQENFNFIEEPTRIKIKEDGLGSTDVGNVTHEIPAIQCYIGFGKELTTHTNEFREISGSQKGNEAVIKAAKVMALTTIDILANKTTYKEIFDALKKTY